jgi:hypothetical protein
MDELIAMFKTRYGFSDEEAKEMAEDMVKSPDLKAKWQARANQAAKTGRGQVALGREREARLQRTQRPMFQPHPYQRPNHPGPPVNIDLGPVTVSDEPQRETIMLDELELDPPPRLSRADLLRQEVARNDRLNRMQRPTWYQPISRMNAIKMHQAPQKSGK